MSLIDLFIDIFECTDCKQIFAIKKTPRTEGVAVEMFPCTGVKPTAKINGICTDCFNALVHQRGPQYQKGETITLETLNRAMAILKEKC